MNKKNIFQMMTCRLAGMLLISLLLLNLQLEAQEMSQQRGPQIVSPEISSNNSVTFRLYSPNANSVTLSGSWAVSRKLPKQSKTDVINNMILCFILIIVKFLIVVSILYYLLK